MIVRGIYNRIDEAVTKIVMPTNLPPDYFEAEKRFREAKTPTDKITCLEEMLTIMPKHKGTDKLRAGLRKRISKLKDTVQAKKGLGKQTSAFRIDKEGAGQVRRHRQRQCRQIGPGFRSDQRRSGSG